MPPRPLRAWDHVLPALGPRTDRAPARARRICSRRCRHRRAHRPNARGGRLGPDLSRACPASGSLITWQVDQGRAPTHGRPSHAVAGRPRVRMAASGGGAEGAEDLKAHYDQGGSRSPLVQVAVPTSEAVVGRIYADLPTETPTGWGGHIERHVLPSAGSQDRRVRRLRVPRKWNDLLVDTAAKIMADRLETIAATLGHRVAWTYLVDAEQINRAIAKAEHPKAFGAFFARAKEAVPESRRSPSWLMAVRLFRAGSIVPRRRSGVRGSRRADAPRPSSSSTPRSGHKSFRSAGPSTASANSAPPMSWTRSVRRDRRALVADRKARRSAMRTSSRSFGSCGTSTIGASRPCSMREQTRWRSSPASTARSRAPTQSHDSMTTIEPSLSCLPRI